MPQLDPYEELAAAICAQAAFDYRSARADMARAEERLDEARRFFRSNACELLAQSDGAGILAMLDREKPKPEPNRGGPSRIVLAALASVRDARDAVKDAADALGPSAPPRLSEALVRISTVASALDALAEGRARP